MSILNALKLSENKNDQPRSREAHLRSKIIEGLETQGRAVEAALKGEPYIKRAKRWIADPETGQKVLKSVPVRFQKWWWESETGEIHFGLRYGNKYLELKPNLHSLTIAKLSDLPETIEKLKVAVRAGELDEAMKKAANARSAQRRPLVRK